MNRLTVRDDTPSDLAACDMVNPCLDIGIDKSIVKGGSMSRGVRPRRQCVGKQSGNRPFFLSPRGCGGLINNSAFALAPQGEFAHWTLDKKPGCLWDPSPEAMRAKNRPPLVLAKVFYPALAETWPFISCEVAVKKGAGAWERRAPMLRSILDDDTVCGSSEHT